MTQRKSNEESANARAIGRRIRALRGATSQLDFASAFGLTRSALVNYELGRSRPPTPFLEKIKERTGVDIDTGPELVDFEDHIRSIVGDGSRLTDDEWAVVRILRIAPPDLARHVVKELVTCVEQRNEGLQLADPQFVAMDLARLYIIASGHAEYLRGVSGEGVIQIARGIAEAAVKRSLPANRVKG